MSSSESGRERTNAARYASLLVAIVALLLVSAVAPSSGGPAPFLQLVATGVLVAALLSTGRDRRVRWAGIALITPALLCDWSAWATDSRLLDALAGLFTVGFLALVTAVIFGALLRSRRVTSDTILGGICVYLLIGVAFATLYSLLEKIAPGSLLEGGVPVSGAGASLPDFDLPQLVYYSFVTLSTLGYGDIVPRSPAARAFAAAEAVLGQVYIAIFVARLVALHVAHEASG